MAELLAARRAAAAYRLSVLLTAAQMGCLGIGLHSPSELSSANGPGDRRRDLADEFLESEPFEDDLFGAGFLGSESSGPDSSRSTPAGIPAASSARQLLIFFMAVSNRVLFLRRFEYSLLIETLSAPRSFLRTFTTLPRCRFVARSI